MFSGFWQNDTDHVHIEWCEHFCLVEQTSTYMVELVPGEQAVCMHDDVLCGQHDRRTAGLIRSI